MATLALASAEESPDARAGDDRADERADGQAANELGDHTLIGHVRRSEAGPRTATADTMAIPTQANTDAPMRW